MKPLTDKQIIRMIKEAEEMRENFKHLPERRFYGPWRLANHVKRLAEHILKHDDLGKIIRDVGKKS